MLVRVALAIPSYRLFDYCVSDATAQHIQTGVRVRVPFGKTLRTGFVVARIDRTEISQHRIKSIEEVLDREPLIPDDLLALLRWGSDYYHHPLGEVIFSALPTGLRRGQNPEKQKKHRQWALTSSGKEADSQILSRAPRQAAIYQHLHRQSPLPEATLANLGGNWRHALKALAVRGWVEQVLTQATTPTKASPDCTPSTPVLLPVHQVPLNAEQNAALARLEETLDTFQVSLLEGVTGSGKTAVYVHAIAKAVQCGYQALFLVPEIGLTPQMLAWVRQVLPCDVRQMHSGLTEQQRLSTWLDARKGTVQVLIGTRSAVFTPFRRLGIIIVDEEHDISYKQQEGFRYSARDLAIRRAQQLGIPVILGSATPSLETVRQAQNRRYQRLYLSSRFGGAQLPEVRIVDMRTTTRRQYISAELIYGLQRNIECGKQSFLFVNQRGYAPVLLCHNCTWTAQCVRCDARMVWHRNQNRLQCHHCAAQSTVPTGCPSCGSQEMSAVGVGTERAVESLAKHFPHASIARVDRDSMRQRGTLPKAITAIVQGKVQLIVGTQMLAKGHHFPNITLVGILDVDGGLFGADFRAPERMAQLIVQVAGRAGRSTLPGTVYLQTHHPHHPLLRQLITHGYGHFTEAALAERAQVSLPPFAAFALLRAHAPQKEDCMAFLEKASELVLTFNQEQIAVLGPACAPMERRRGQFRAQLLLQAPKRSALQYFLRGWVPYLEQIPHPRYLRWSIDVDPQEMS